MIYQKKFEHRRGLPAQRKFTYTVFFCYNESMKEYIKYLKDNPKGYWFKRKLYGWGWTPATWQGWLLTLVFIGIVLLLTLTIDESSSEQEVLSNLIIPIALLTLIFLKINYLKGEKPKWMWGIPRDDSE
jgi:hypothetical protein